MFDSDIPLTGGAGSSLLGLLRSEREQARRSPLSSWLPEGSVLPGLLLLPTKNQTKQIKKHKIIQKNALAHPKIIHRGKIKDETCDLKNIFYFE